MGRESLSRYYRRVFLRAGRESWALLREHAWWDLAIAIATLVVFLVVATASSAIEGVLYPLAALGLVAFSAILVNLVRAPVLVHRELRTRVEELESCSEDDGNDLAGLAARLRDHSADLRGFVQRWRSATPKPRLSDGREKDPETLEELRMSMDTGFKELERHGKALELHQQALIAEYEQQFAGRSYALLRALRDAGFIEAEEVDKRDPPKKLDHIADLQRRIEYLARRIDALAEGSAPS